MSGKSENDIVKLLELYRRYNEEYEKIMQTMDDQYIRVTLGYPNDYWSKRQKEDILKQFQEIVNKRIKLRNDINRYYLNKIRDTPPGSGRCVLSVQYNNFKRMIRQKSSAWASVLDTSRRTKNNANSKSNKFSAFTRIIKRIKKRLGCGS